MIYLHHLNFAFLFIIVWSCMCLSACLYCLQSLSRLTQVVPAVFLAVIDTCGPAAILEGVGGAGARVQQHLLTAMATALVSSRIQTHRVTQNRVRIYSHTSYISTGPRNPDMYKQLYCFNHVFIDIFTEKIQTRFRW